MGGTATGGATFLGLMQLLGPKARAASEGEGLSFADAVALAAQGNAANVDKLVRRLETSSFILIFFFKEQCACFQRRGGLLLLVSPAL